MTSPTNTAGLYLLMKRGLYYRPDAMGYTGIKDHAGRYTREVAESHADPASGVTMILEAEADEFSPSCYDDLARDHLLTRAQAAEARVAELEAAKWETQHADTMNDLVAMGLARDAAEARADRLATLVKRLSEDLSAALERAYEADAEWVKAKYPNGASPIRLLAALQDQPK